MSKLPEEEVKDKRNRKNQARLKMKIKRKPKTYFHAHFDKDNLEERQPLLADRDYGLMKTTQTATPYPKKHKALNAESLKARLEAHKEDLSTSNLVSTDSSSDSLNDPYTFDEPILSFYMRRKIFDTAEYTICKGQKMSETFHHGSKVLHVPQERDGSTDGRSVRGSSHAFTFHSYKDLQDYCLTKNIKLAN